MGVYLLSDLGLDGTWPTSLWEEVSVSRRPHARCLGLGIHRRYLGRDMLGAGHAAQRKGSGKINLDEE